MISSARNESNEGIDEDNKDIDKWNNHYIYDIHNRRVFYYIRHGEFLEIRCFI